MEYRRGSEVWAIFFDLERYAYRPGLLGRVERVDARRGALVGGKWEPHGAHRRFGSEAEARQWCDEHPFAAPEAPKQFGNAR